MICTRNKAELFSMPILIGCREKTVMKVHDIKVKDYQCVTIYNRPKS